MDRESARQEIKANTEQLLDEMTGRAKKSVNNAVSFVCPKCSHGKNGDGLAINPKSKSHTLHCFSCGWNGDVIQLYEDINNTNYNKALHELADKLGITIDKYKLNISQEAGRSDNDKGGEDTEPTPQEETSPTIPKDFTEYYKTVWEKLTEPDALEYLQKRGISIETAQAYKLGYDESWRSPTALEAGKNPEPTPRLIIPTSIHHYVARDVRDGLTDYQQNFKKINEGSPDLFNKAVLYDEDVKEIYVAEGALDALSVIEAGYTAIALNGTTNDKLLLQELEKKPTGATLIICLDNDKAGKRAAERLKEGLERLNVSYIFKDICLGYTDPNEALTSDRQTFIEMLEGIEASKPDSLLNYLDEGISSDIESQRKGISTGFKNLDTETGGLRTGLYILAAVSSLGKTTFCGQIADQLAASGNDVLFFSIEQSRLEIVSKSLARVTALNNKKTALTRDEIFEPENAERKAETIDAYKRAVKNHISVIEGNFDFNVSDVSSYVSRYMRKNPKSKPIVFIDYLQILQPEKARASTKESVDITITTLKRLSRKLGITIIAISSVNRESYYKNIGFESLKESGGIEYTADTVFGLQYACVNNEIKGGTQAERQEAMKELIKKASNENPRKIELVCMKNRGGRKDWTCNFNYYADLDYFEESAAKHIQKTAGRRI